MAVAAISQPVLVLNRGFQPILVVSVRKALMMLSLGRAKAVNHTDPKSYETYDWDDWSEMKPETGDDIVRTVKKSIVAPRAVVLADYDRLPNRGVTCSRLNLFKRDKYTCQYCNRQPGTEELTLDHVKPRAQGGIFSWDNIVVACVDCNQKKANRTPKEAGMRLRRMPVKPEWRPIYAEASSRFESWRKFISEIYWRTPLQQG